MGATISVTNQSDVPVNIALKQVGVLYWRNYVLPGETVVWTIGRVWVTVEAIVDNEFDDRTRYRELDRILPIALATGGVLAVAGGAVVAAAPVIVGTGVAAGAAALGGATVATEATGAAITAAAAEAIVSSGAATAGGAAAGAAAGAFAREVAGAFGKKAVGTAADIAVDSTISAVGKQRGKDPKPQVVKAKKYGVFSGNNPKLVVQGHRRLIALEYVEEKSQSS